MLEFLKGPFFVLHFSYNTLMTLLMMLSIKFLSLLMIPGLKIRHFLSAGSFPSYLSSPENQVGSEGELLDPPGVLGGGG